ncbi:hypothetical protein AB0H57_31640 [Micromonospora sp. NPDC050686]
MLHHLRAIADARLRCAPLAPTFTGFWVSYTGGFQYALRSYSTPPIR